MAGRWRVAMAAGGAFVAVAGLGIGLAAAHGGSGGAQPGSSRPVFVGPLVIRVTSPPKIVHVDPGTKVVPTT
jgi:hypothetical protein